MMNHCITEKLWKSVAVTALVGMLLCLVGCSSRNAQYKPQHMWARLPAAMVHIPNERTNPETFGRADFPKPAYAYHQDVPRIRGYYQRTYQTIENNGHTPRDRYYRRSWTTNMAMTYRY